LGIVVLMATDGGWVGGISVVLLVMGAMLIMLSPFQKGASSYGPSNSMYHVVGGSVLLSIGVIGIYCAFMDVELWVAAVAFLIAIAAIGIGAALANGRKEV